MLPGGTHMFDNVSKLVGYTVITLFLAVISLTNDSAAATAPLVTVLTPPITSNVGSPLRIAFDSKGDFFVADPRMGGVSKFSNQGQSLEVIKIQGPAYGVALESKGSLLVGKGDAVAVLDGSGNEIHMLGSGAGQFKKTSGIAVDAADFVYVADSKDNNVKVFTSAGSFVKAIGTPGDGNGQFNMPTGVTYERTSNQIAVTDTANGRVQFFNAGGNFEYVKTIGSFGVGQLRFRTPVGVTFEYATNGEVARMYVVDTYQNNIQVIDPAGAGTYLSTIGASGFSSGDLMVPLDVAFDQVNRRLLVVNGSGQITQYGIDGGNTQAVDAPKVLGVDPIPHRVNNSSITISGTVDGRYNVEVKTKNNSAPLQVVYTSANTWKCNVSGLTRGSNTISIKAVDANGVLAKHAVGVIYTP